MKSNKTLKTSGATAKPKKPKASITAATLTIIAFILFCFWMLPLRNGYMLRWFEEMSLFESTRFFFLQCLYFPGGLLRYAGAWLTQLMFYPWLGSTVLIMLWILLGWLTTKAFRLPRAAFPFALAVPMMLLLSVVQMDDAWLSMKTVGYFYSNTLGYIFAIGTIWLSRHVEKRQYLSFIVLMLTTACYFIAGFYALFAAFIGVILMVADAIRTKRYAALAFVAVIVAFVLILPNLYYTYFQPTTVDNDYLYLKGLPDLLMERFDLYLWKPFIAASAALLVIAVMSAGKWIPDGRLVLWAGLAVLLVSGVWCVKADRKNEQLRATVLMLQHLEQNDWEGIIGVMSRIKEPPNYTMKMLNNLAIVNLGGKGENLDGMKPRNYDARHAEGFSVTAYVNVPVNYFTGSFNQSYRWGMEHSIQYGKRVFFLKYMIKSALLKGEYKLAKRYNDILLGTLFYRDWAEEMNRYIDDPSLIGSNPEFKNVLQYADSH